MKQNVASAITFILVLFVTFSAFAGTGLRVSIENITHRDYKIKIVNEHCISYVENVPSSIYKTQNSVMFVLNGRSSTGCTFKSSGIQIQIINSDGTTVGEFTAHKPNSKPWINLSCSRQKSEKEYLECSGQNTVLILPK